MEASSTDQRGLSFDERLEKLEKIVEELEDGQMGLEKSLELFEEAVAIAKSCRAELAEAELRISRLTSEIDCEGVPDDGEARDESR